MSDPKKNPARIVLPDARLAFPALFAPKTTMKGDPNAAEKYQATFLLPPDTDLKPLKAALMAAAKAKWGAKWEEVVKAMRPDRRNPIRDAGEKKHLNGFKEGWYFINTKSGNKPPVVDQKLEKVTQPELVYPGCWVKGCITAFGYERQTGNGLSFGLEAIQFVRHEERLDGRVDAQSVFEAVAFDGDALTDEAFAGVTEDFGGASSEPAVSSAEDMFS